MYRNVEIEKLWRVGIPTASIAETFGIGRRTVQHAMIGVPRAQAVTVVETASARPKDLVAGIVSAYKVSLEEMKGKSHKERIAAARHHLMYLLRTKAKWSLKEIGYALGNRDHSTVIYGCKRAAERLAERAGMVDNEDVEVE